VVYILTPGTRRLQGGVGTCSIDMQGTVLGGELERREGNRLSYYGSGSHKS
jgi:hypothetical protein